MSAGGKSVIIECTFVLLSVPVIDYDSIHLIA